MRIGQKAAIACKSKKGKKTEKKNRKAGSSCQKKELLPALGLVGYYQGTETIGGVLSVEQVQRIGVIGVHAGGSGGYIVIVIGSGPGNVHLIPAWIKAGVRGYFPVTDVGKGRVGVSSAL